MSDLHLPLDRSLIQILQRALGEAAESTVWIEGDGEKERGPSANQITVSESQQAQMIVRAREIPVDLNGFHQEAFGEGPVAQQQMCVPKSV